MGLALCFGAPVGALFDPSGPARIDGPDFDLAGIDSPAVLEDPTVGYTPIDVARSWSAGVAIIKFIGGSAFNVRVIPASEEGSQ